MRARSVLAAAFAASFVAFPATRAQPPRRDAPLAELRVDALVGDDPIVQLGAGVGVPLSTYVRLVGIAAGGARWASDGAEPSARADVLARFTFDPLRQSRWAPYGAGGVAVLWDDTEDWRGRLVAAVGLEGPARGRWATAFELGLGGGVRVGVVMRRAQAGRR